MPVHGHFEETCAVELPSQLESYPSSKGFQGVPVPLKCTGTRSTEYCTRIATEHHSLQISMGTTTGGTHEIIETTSRSLPNRHLTDQDQLCIAHSFLSINNERLSGYLEVFSLTLSRNEKGNGGSGAAAAGGKKADDRKDLVSQSSFTGDVKLDESRSTIDRSGHPPSGSNENKYFIVIKGSLDAKSNPTANTAGKSDTDTGFDGYDGYRDRDEERVLMSNRTNNHNHPTSKPRKKEKKIKETDPHSMNTNTTCNVYQSFPVSFCPSTVELVQVEEGAGSNGFGNYIIYAADNLELKMFSLTSRDVSEMNIDVSVSDEKFDMVEDALALIPRNGNDGENDNTSTSTANDPKPPSNDFTNLFLQDLNLNADIGIAETSTSTSPLLFRSPITVVNTSITVRKSDLASIHTLSVGCQDGSIRIITYALANENGNEQEQEEREDKHCENNQLKDMHQRFEILNISNFVIDGPVSALSYSRNESIENEEVRLVLFAGSVCGFACWFYQIPNCDDYEFQGAYPLIDGLWDNRLRDDDAVLSIREFQYGGVEGGSIVAIGLYSGRLLLFERRTEGRSEDDNEDTKNPYMYFTDKRDSATFHCVWNCTLPYPIRDIQVVADGIFSDMVVCTKRSIHLLRSNPDFFGEAAFERVERLINQFVQK